MRLSLIVMLVGCGAVAQAGACPDEPTWKAQVLQQVNHIRAAGGVCSSGARYAPATRAVGWNEALERVALMQAMWMSERGQLVHSGRRGEGIGERARQAHYDYERVGENIAMGYDQVSEVMRAWLASAKHCENLLNPHYTEIALACVRGTQGPWWAITLGRPGSNTWQMARAQPAAWPASWRP